MWVSSMSTHGSTVYGDIACVCWWIGSSFCVFTAYFAIQHIIAPSSWLVSHKNNCCCPRRHRRTYTLFGVLTMETSERTRCSCQIIICVSRRIMLKTKTCCKMLSTAPHYYTGVAVAVLSAHHQMNVSKMRFSSLASAHSQLWIRNRKVFCTRRRKRDRKKQREK